MKRTLASTLGLLFVVSCASPNLWSQATITAVNVLPQASPTGDTKQLVVEIIGTNLWPNSDHPAVLLVPGIEGVATFLGANTDTSIKAEFTVPRAYVLQQIMLSYAARSVSFTTGGTSCSDQDIRRTFNFVNNNKVKNTFGNGIAKNFHVIKVSIVNRCEQGIVVPLAGMIIAPRNADDSTALSPYTLPQVTAIYTIDRKLTGSRAIFFNILSAMTTLGSAVQPFLGPGFTQGVAILGGGFTTAASAIFKDVSPEQLQNISALSFGDSEQIGPNGDSLTKYLFLGKAPKDQDDPFSRTPDIDQQVNGLITWSTTGSSTTTAIVH